MPRHPKHQEFLLSPNPYPVPQSNRTLTIVSWGITLLVSTLPDIVWVTLAGITPVWLTFAKMGLLLSFALAACIWRPLRPLRNYCIVLFAFFGLSELRPHINFTSSVVQAVFGASVFDVRMQAEQ